ncbi:MAG: polyphosphate kinase [Pseudomonadota bacterium]
MGKKKGRLASLDMDRQIKRSLYEQKLTDLQLKLTQIQQAYMFSGDSAVLVFEGWDAAGKGGVIRRISAAMDPRTFKVWPIAAPRDYYKRRHYLARFVERLPPDGAISVFDRSWYGRVLVERVEGFATAKRWRQAYDEINQFEKLLADDGTRVLKFFLYITPEEQLSRFEQRLHDPLKQWKLSFEDFRNRERWDDYVDAVEDMLDKTSTKSAPWHVIPANTKKWARIEIMQTVVRKLSKGVELGPGKVDGKMLDAATDHLQIPAELMAQLNARRI